MTRNSQDVNALAREVKTLKKENRRLADAVAVLNQEIDRLRDFENDAREYRNKLKAPVGAVPNEA
jgi:hypothetical protein